MYIVIELQTNAEGAVANIVTAFADRNSAEQKFHTVLAAAAVSSVPIHAAVLLTNSGKALDSGCFYHAAEPEE